MSAQRAISGQRAIMTDDADVAWRFFLVNWVVIGVMGVVVALGLVAANFSLELSGLAVAVGYVGLYGGFAHANARSPTRRDPQVMFVLGGTAQIVLMTAVMTPMTYVAASTGFPMRDADLFAIDRALGFDWGAYVHYVDAHPILANWLNIGYAMIRWPIFAIPVALAALGRYRRIEEFTFAFGLALIVTTIVSAFVPAIGAYQEIGLDPATLKHIDPSAYLDQLRNLPSTRAGTLRHLQLLNLGGIVTFPSFHAASAILYAWALWPLRWARPIVLLTNGLMLAATPLNGGHYLVDVIAGVAIAVIAIAAAWQLGRIIARQQPSPGLVPAPAQVPAQVPAIATAE
jgi:PAP2 superfamily